MIVVVAFFVAPAYPTAAAWIIFGVGVFLSLWAGLFPYIMPKSAPPQATMDLDVAPESRAVVSTIPFVGPLRSTLALWVALTAVFAYPAAGSGNIGQVWYGTGIGLIILGIAWGGYSPVVARRLARAVVARGKASIEQLPVAHAQRSFCAFRYMQYRFKKAQEQSLASNEFSKAIVKLGDRIGWAHDDRTPGAATTTHSGCCAAVSPRQRADLEFWAWRKAVQSTADPLKLLILLQKLEDSIPAEKMDRGYLKSRCDAQQQTQSVLKSMRDWDKTRNEDDIYTAGLIKNRLEVRIDELQKAVPITGALTPSSCLKLMEGNKHWMLLHENLKFQIIVAAFDADVVLALLEPLLIPPLRTAYEAFGNNVAIAQLVPWHFQDWSQVHGVHGYFNARRQHGCDFLIDLFLLQHHSARRDIGTPAGLRVDRQRMKTAAEIGSKRRMLRLQEEGLTSTDTYEYAAMSHSAMQLPTTEKDEMWLPVSRYLNQQ